MVRGRAAGGLDLLVVAAPFIDPPLCPVGVVVAGWNA